MEVTIEPINEHFKETCDAYTVHVGDHRILTVCTKSELTATKWLKNALKSHNTKLPSKLVVGVAATTKTFTYNKGGVLDTPYNLLQLCIGSHCLLYTLPGYSCIPTPPKSLQNFFQDPRVMPIGVDIQTVAKNLEKHYGINIGEAAVDINELAVKGMKRDDLDLGRYDLERLGMAVFGAHMYVKKRTEKKVDWYETKRQCFNGMWVWAVVGDELNPQVVKNATVDPYLCFMIGSQLLDMIHAPSSSGGGAASKKMKKKKN